MKRKHVHDLAEQEPTGGHCWHIFNKSRGLWKRTSVMLVPSPRFMPSSTIEVEVLSSWKL